MTFTDEKPLSPLETLIFFCMSLMETGLIAFSAVSAVGTVAAAYYYAELRKAEITQAGIDRRAALKVGDGSTSSYQKGEWWETLLIKLAENPEVMKQITPHIPTLIEKFAKK